jgi:tetratricopeptide (TPR) repeat protein
MIYSQRELFDQAIADFNKALEIDPKYTEAYISRGKAYYFKGEYDKAWGDIKKAQGLGYKIPAEFLDTLRKASEKNK